jgi:hypothetical protein
LKGITTRKAISTLISSSKKVALFPFLKGITTLPVITLSFCIFHKCCTISVFEGNYDFKFQFYIYFLAVWVALFPFLKGITTKNTHYLYNNNLVALFPFLKGITTLLFKIFSVITLIPFSLHYFRF